MHSSPEIELVKWATLPWIPLAVGYLWYQYSSLAIVGFR